VVAAAAAALAVVDIPLGRVSLVGNFAKH